MPTPVSYELLSLVMSPAHLIEVRTDTAPPMEYTLPYWDYADSHGVRVRVHYPDGNPYLQIYLVSYAGVLSPDPTMLPFQPDEPLRFDDKTTNTLPAMVMFSAAYPALGTKVLVVCQHTTPHDGTTHSQELCRNSFASNSYVEITPA